MAATKTFLGGITVGAGLAYFLDAERGADRREQWAQRLAPLWDDARQLLQSGTGSSPTTHVMRYGDRIGDLPGMGPVTAPTVRAFLADGSGFTTAKAAASYVGITPSNWSSGTVTQPSRAITKEGPAVLRLAFYQAGNAARRTDPQLAAFYHRLMAERGHCHTQATVAVARKLVERTWAVLDRGTPYRLRDLDGQPISERAAKALVAEQFTVADNVRARARAHSAATHRSKLTR